LLPIFRFRKCRTIFSDNFSCDSRNLAGAMHQYWNCDQRSNHF
jgi:hypothetical protein